MEQGVGGLNYILQVVDRKCLASSSIVLYSRAVSDHILTRKDIYLVIYKSNIVTSLDSVHFLVLVALEVLEIRRALVLNLVPITNSFVIEIAAAKLDMEFQRIRNIKG